MADILQSLDPVRFTSEIVTKSLPAYLTSLPIPKSAGDLLSLSLSDVYDLFPLIIVILSPLILVQFLKKVAEAHDSEKCNTGILQFSGFFYQGDGPLMAVPFLLGFVPGAICMLATHLTGKWSWATFIAGYVLVPVVDLFIGEDSYNPTQEDEDKLKNNIWFRVITWMYTPSYIVTILYGCYVVQTRPEMSNWEFWGISVGTGIAGGFGIGCVHEIIHRPHFADLFHGIVACVFANYGHFWIEHLWGHHKNVATELDPASSAKGDNLYTFLARDMWYSFWEAVDIEKKICKKEGKSVLQNRILQAYICSALICYAIFSQFGTRALYFHLIQGFVTAIHIENANFIEHYGLRRRKMEDGKHERPGWFHAWDTADRFTNWILFKIQRHPDHHVNACRPYQILRTLPQSPHYPTGYAGMFVLSWFPPLWWAVMDPLVEHAYENRAKMEAMGIAASAFPSGSNNISSFFCREGEGFFSPGSSPYSTGAKFYTNMDGEMQGKKKDNNKEDFHGPEWQAPGINVNKADPRQQGEQAKKTK